MSNSSFWREIAAPSFSRVSATGEYDVIVVGGGIAGLTAALLLKEAGKTVCVLERETIGAVESGNTTAHLTYVTDERLSELARTFGRDEARLAWQSGSSAIRLIEQVVERLQILRFPPCRRPLAPAGVLRTRNRSCGRSRGTSRGVPAGSGARLRC